MTRNQGVNIESTPTSRWAYRYRKKYGYTFYGLIAFVGIITLRSGFLFIGGGIAVIGAVLLINHYKYHNK